MKKGDILVVDLFAEDCLEGDGGEVEVLVGGNTSENTNEFILVILLNGIRLLGSEDDLSTADEEDADYTWNDE